MKYRADIDGLRAVAIVPVILFHFGIGIFPGGFIGVDIFFVISGFLISSIIVEEIRNGSFSLTSFYERRIRRLMPVYFAVIALSCVASLTLFSPKELVSFLDSSIYSLFFASNIFFWNNFGYFTDTAERLPLLHTWSLGVEEQFYLFFPLILIVIFKTKLRLHLTAVVVFMLVSSFIISCYGSYTHPLASYYLLPTRAWELLFGVLAFVVRDKLSLSEGKKGIDTLLLLFFAGLLLFLVQFNNSLPFPGPWALLPVLAVFLILVFDHPDYLMHKILSNEVFVFIGLISYSLYMFHQPIVVFYKYMVVPDEHGLIHKLMLISFTFFVAYASYLYIEAPFRNKKTFSRQKIYKLFYGSFAFTLLSLVLIRGTVDVAPQVLYADNVVAVDKLVKPNIGLSDTCDLGQYGFAVKCQNSANPEWVVWGDSLGMHTASAIGTDDAIKLVQKTFSACPPILDFSVMRNDHTGKWARKCIRNNHEVFSYITDNPKIKYVVLTSTFDYQYSKNYYDNEIRDYNERVVLNKLVYTINALKLAGKKVVVVSPPPRSYFDPGFCFVRSVVNSFNREQCNFNNDTSITSVSLLSQVEDVAPVISLSKYFCESDGHCIASFSGKPLFRDSIHLTKSGAAYLGRDTSFIEDLVTDVGITDIATAEHTLGQR
ncbi:acyltransferase family protein [Shewanella sp.]|uniref:acyltransferase family protein n=1 Tax=Shewanella sp. TaxID=50422 RepID=UPI003A975217